jgi:predicted RNase H-like HicB family nuclease
MKYHFKIHKEGNGYWAECLELSGCVTVGETKEELSYNMHEALNLYLAEPADSKIIFPMPKKQRKSANIVAVPVETQVALAFILRHLRLKRQWTQQHVANLLGKKLFAYQRLENPETANPEWNTLVAIKQKVFPEMKLDALIA